MSTTAFAVPFKAEFDPNSQEFALSGVVRPRSADEIAASISMLKGAIEEVRGVLYINVKRLVQMNNTAYHAFARVLLDACRTRSDIRFVVVTSSVVGWTERMFAHLNKIEPQVTVEVYDSKFYPGQSFVENTSFIPILRTQTKMTWRHERKMLPRHGLRPGMTMADICCGIGDFAMLVRKEFQPARIVALDHSKASLAYARDVASGFGVTDIEYTYGDASEMLLEDNQFDFVTCRHSLQIFNQPDVLLKELFRICKPGGRVYITNEKIPTVSANRAHRAFNGPTTRSRGCSAISKWMWSSDRRASAILSTPALTISTLNRSWSPISTEILRTSPISSLPGRTSMPVKWP